MFPPNGRCVCVSSAWVNGSGATLAARPEPETRASIPEVAHGVARELGEAGLAKVIEEGKGSKPATWQLLPGEPKAGNTVLPSVKQVFGGDC